MDTHPEYLEHQEGPDGQHCDLLNRVPYDNQRKVEAAFAWARSPNDRLDAALRGMLWTPADVDEYHVGCKPRVKHMLTGEITDDLGAAGTDVVQPWRVRASELYNAWSEIAFPGPKGSSRTGNRTPTSGKAKTSTNAG